MSELMFNFFFFGASMGFICLGIVIAGTIGEIILDKLIKWIKGKAEHENRV